MHTLPSLRVLLILSKINKLSAWGLLCTGHCALQATPRHEGYLSNLSIMPHYYKASKQFSILRLSN
jgi:hypothetical protein